MRYDDKYPEWSFQAYRKRLVEANGGPVPETYVEPDLVPHGSSYPCSVCREYTTWTFDFKLSGRVHICSEECREKFYDPVWDDLEFSQSIPVSAEKVMEVLIDTIKPE